MASDELIRKRARAFTLLGKPVGLQLRRTVQLNQLTMMSAEVFMPLSVGIEVYVVKLKTAVCASQDVL
jgi:hypothetical protein